jgi:hypothetical protein
MRQQSFPSCFCSFNMSKNFNKNGCKLNHKETQSFQNYLKNRQEHFNFIKRLTVRYKYSDMTLNLAKLYLDILMQNSCHPYFQSSYKFDLKMDLVCISVVLLASKFIENDPRVPDLNDFQGSSSPSYFTLIDIVKVEEMCCKLLQYKMSYFTIFDYLQFFISYGIVLRTDYPCGYNYDDLDIENINQQCIKIANNFSIDPLCLDYSPLQVACSAISIVRENMDIEKPWSEVFQKLYKICFVDFSECYEFMKNIYINKRVGAISTKVSPICTSKNVSSKNMVHVSIGEKASGKEDFIPFTNKPKTKTKSFLIQDNYSLMTKSIAKSENKKKEIDTTYHFQRSYLNNLNNKTNDEVNKTYKKVNSFNQNSFISNNLVSKDTSTKGSEESMQVDADLDLNFEKCDNLILNNLMRKGRNTGTYNFNYNGTINNTICGTMTDRNDIDRIINPTYKKMESMNQQSKIFLNPKDIRNNGKIDQNVSIKRERVDTEDNIDASSLLNNFAKNKNDYLAKGRVPKLSEILSLKHKDSEDFYSNGGISYSNCSTNTTNTQNSNHKQGRVSDNFNLDFEPQRTNSFNTNLMISNKYVSNNENKYLANYQTTQTQLNLQKEKDSSSILKKLNTNRSHLNIDLKSLSNLNNVRHYSTNFVNNKSYLKK